MRSVAEITIDPAELGFWVLRGLPEMVTAEEAAGAVRHYVERKRSGLAEVLQVAAREGAVVVRAEGEFPEETLREFRDLLDAGRVMRVAGEIDVPPEEFAIDAGELPEEAFDETETLRSHVRYFPHPVCEWFEVSAGELVLTDRQVLFEPQWQITREEDAGPSGEHRIPLADVQRFWRGEWWDVPCLMLQTAGRTYRYGWSAGRGEPESVFDVDEWLEHLRSILGREQ